MDIIEQSEVRDWECQTLAETQSECCRWMMAVIRFSMHEMGPSIFSPNFAARLRTSAEVISGGGELRFGVWRGFLGFFFVFLFWSFLILLWAWLIFASVGIRDSNLGGNIGPVEREDDVAGFFEIGIEGGLGCFGDVGEVGMLRGPFLIVVGDSKEVGESINGEGPHGVAAFWKMIGEVEFLVFLFFEVF